MSRSILVLAERQYLVMLRLSYVVLVVVLCIHSKIMVLRYFCPIQRTDLTKNSVKDFYVKVQKFIRELDVNSVG